MDIFRIDLDNEIEAEVFSALLDEEEIPHAVFNHFDLAYDGLFQMTLGWGHIEIPYIYGEKAFELFQNYKKSLKE